MWPLSKRNRTKNDMNTIRCMSPKLSHQKQATENHNKTTALERSVMNARVFKHVLRRQPRPQFGKWYKTIIWLFSLHDIPLTRQYIVTVNKLSCFNTIRSKDEDSTDTTFCVTDGDPWSAKQPYWKSKAKEDHQLSPD